MLSVILFGGICAAQADPAVEDFQPATSNQLGKAYPQVNSEGRVRASISAPEAKSVQLDIGGVKYDLIKNEEGVWTGDSAPQDEGFHYYQLCIDGAAVPDPGSLFFYGAGRWGSAVEVPTKDQDFYAFKDVAHGTIRSEYYFSKTTDSWRHLNVYAPPGYDQNSLSYPVLYIQHGGGEDESGWAVQGKTNLILDNLIAEGKAVPMLVVMANGNVSSPGARGGYSREGMVGIGKEFIQNIVPFIEKNYRAIPDAKHRALAGLSMGGGQAFYVGLQNPDIFASVGVFSSGLFGGVGFMVDREFDAEAQIPGLLTRARSFNDQLDLFYISVGQQDPRITNTKKAVVTLREHGLEVQYNDFPGGHEWQVWRRSLHDFAQKLFK